MTWPKAIVLILALTTGLLTLKPVRKTLDKAYLAAHAYASNQSLPLYELWLLTRDELNSSRSQAVSHAPTLQFMTGEEELKNFVSLKSGPSVYVDSNLKEIEVDAKLPLPSLKSTSAETLDTPYPQFEVRNEEKVGLSYNYYFEFDTVPTFDSPLLFRYPPLLPRTEREDNRTLKGLKLQVFRSPQKEIDASQKVFTFPFRVTALSDLHVRPGLEDLTARARILGHGYEPHRIMNEIYQYIRLHTVRGSDSIRRNPVDVYYSNVAECGNINGLLVTMAELNGLKTRLVSGFNPRVREYHPGAGHTAAEIYNEKSGRWSYLDAYLHLFFNDMTAKDLQYSPVAFSVPVVRLNEALQTEFGGFLSLAKLFTYRRYSDFFNRSLPQNMFQLDEDDESYAMNAHSLETLQSQSETKSILKAENTLWVRTRYIVTDGEKLRYYNDVAQKSSFIKASPWAIKKFNFNAKDLLHIK